MKVLLAPLLVRGHGTGHVRRCLDLADGLGECAAFVTGLDAQEPLAEALGSRPRVSAGVAEAGPAIVVADRRATGAAAYGRLAAMGPVIGIDEGGPARRWMSCLIDTPLSGRSGANLTSPRFLDLPPRRRASDRPIERLLVSFGGEDPAGLSGQVLRALLDGKLCQGRRITVVQGPYFRETRWPEGVEVLVSPERLRDRLHEYDVVLTAFGLTCYEALAAGVPVILVSPARVHRRLARRAGLPEVGLRRVRSRALRRALSDTDGLQRCVERFHAARGGSGPGASLADVVAVLRPSGAGCPVCGAGGGRRRDRAVARFEDKSYFRCLDCGLLYMVRLSGEAVDYGHGYFFESYRQQYGRTYLEDFDAIRRVSLERLSIIEGVAGPVAGQRLLDVGCAFGPFLAAARSRGAEPAGVEVSPEAVAHVRETLNLPCWQGRFEEYDGEAGAFEVLSMWYVIEHFASLGPVLKQVNRLVARGGLFAFSTPNALGVSGRARSRGFLEESPADHFTIWDPPRARRLLARYGFRLVRLRVTGHHAERFPAAGRLPAGSPALRVLGAASRLFGLGDTFEAYAIKVRDSDG